MPAPPLRIVRLRHRIRVTRVNAPPVACVSMMQLARGLALGLGIPAIGVTGFEALAFGIALPVTVALDAPRGQVYVQRFDDGAETAQILEAAPLGARRMQDVTVAEFIAAMAQVGRAKATVTQPRPAPFYLRSADAAPSTDPVPVMLP